MGVNSQRSSPPHASHLTTRLVIPRYSNLDLQTQEAYEMAVRGSIRPMNQSPMLITGIRCLHFAPPEFLLGKLSWEVGAGRWGSWAWGVTAECRGRGQRIAAPISAGQLPSQPWAGLGRSHSTQNKFCPISCQVSL